MRIILFVIALVISVGSAEAAELKIAATVGDEAITTYDMVNRTRLIMFSTGLQPDRETFNKIAPQALQSLINDKILLQEADRLSIKVPEEDMANAKKSIEQKNGLQPGQLSEVLAQNSIPESTMDNQIKAQIAQALIRQMKIRPLVNISDDEVEDFVRAQSFNQEVEEYYLNEIVLPVEVPEDEDKTKELANKLYQEIKAGKDFKAMAREFSASASAFNDGAVGWMPENQIPKEILAEIKKNEIGVVSEPIRSIEGFFLVKATEKRKQNSIAQEDEINLKQFEMPFPEKTDPKQIKANMEKLTALTYDDEACQNPESFAMRNGFSSKDYGQMKIADLEGKMKPLVSELEVGKFSAPVKTAKSGVVFLVCERIENIAPLIDDTKREAARQALYARKMDLQSRKYLRDLRRKTNIEVRL